MLSHLPGWVKFSVFILSLLAGTINVVGYLGFEHQSASYLSGIATMLGAKAVIEGDISFHLLAILISFSLGAAVSGFFISSGSLSPGRRYDTVLILEGVSLLAAIYLLDRHILFGHYLTSMACGIQNAMATRYSGIVIRTTHITGLFTDLGIMLGRALRGEKPCKRTTSLFLLIITGFIVGGSAGAFLYHYYSFVTLAFPAFACFVLAISYRLFSSSMR